MKPTTSAGFVLGLAAGGPVVIGLGGLLAVPRSLGGIFESCLGSLWGSSKCKAPSAVLKLRTYAC